MGAYPTAEDLQAFCLNAGVITAGSDLTLDYGYAIASAVKQFEQDSGWEPFLATAQTRRYDMPLPDGKILDLRAGVLAVENFVISGTHLTQDVDYVLYPLNAPNVGKPYSWVEFVSRYTQWWPWQMPATVYVTGTFGYAAECPVDVRRAILSLACSQIIASKAGAATGALIGIKQDDVEVRYAQSALNDGLTPQQAQLEAFYAQVLAGYRRVRIY